MDVHNTYMERAIRIAQKGQRNTSPNPLVGCILVKDNQIIGEGYHEVYGGPHAEELAIKNSFLPPVDSTAYITLEPCCIDSKTPPCTNLLIENGIREVFIEMIDPNPNISGKGIDQLNSAGIITHVGLCQDKAVEMNKGFIKWVTTGRPWVIGKVAQSIDGYMGLNCSSQIWLTGKETKRDTHQLRASVDAIMVGRQTASIDNPKLTVRNVKGENPIRVIVDTNRKLPLTLNVFRDGAAETIILCSQNNFLQSRTSFCKYLPVKEENNKLSTDHILLVLGQEGITNLLIEGGAELLNSFICDNLIDEIYLYTSPQKLKNAQLKNPLIIDERWEIQNKKQCGKDSLVTAIRKEKCLQES